MRLRSIATLTAVAACLALSNAAGADVVPEPVPGEDDDAISATMKTTLGVGAFLSLVILMLSKRRHHTTERPS